MDNKNARRIGRRSFTLSTIGSALIPWLSTNSQAEGFKTKPERHIFINGTEDNERADYKFTVSGEIQQGWNKKGEINNTSATGTVWGSWETDYFITGELTSFSSTGDVVIYSVHKDQPPTQLYPLDTQFSTLAHHIFIKGISKKSGYKLTVTGSLESGWSNEGNDSIEGDSIEGQCASGVVWSWKYDDYFYSGSIDEITIDGDVELIVDGEKLDPASLNEDETSQSTLNDNMIVGVSDGSDPQSVTQGNRFDQWLEGEVDVQNIFIPWDDAGYELDELFTQTIPGLWESERQPMLTWELFLTSGSTPDDILSRVASGEYDSYIDEWMSRLNRAATESSISTPTVYIRLGHEMNGNWYPWAPAGGDGTPEAYLEMWKHVWTRVENQSQKDIQIRWVWAANHVDVGEFTMEELYPGDEYVDWLAIDGYNWGESQSWSEWRSPEEIFQQPLQRLASLGDGPLAVTEIGSSSLSGGEADIQRKSEWITDAFIMLNNYNVNMCIWFNEDKESDWAVFGGQRGDEQTEIDKVEYNTYSAFKNSIHTKT